MWSWAVSNLDPFVVEWPTKWVQDPEIGPVVTYLNRFVNDLFLRSGGGDDAIVETQIVELYEPGIQTGNYEELLEELELDVEMLGGQGFDPSQLLPSVTVESAAYTTAGSITVIATSNITVTLNASPDTGETVTIKRATTAGTVTIDGNGKNIDGASTHTLILNYESRNILYVTETDEWLIV